MENKEFEVEVINQEPEVKEDIANEEAPAEVTGESASEETEEAVTEASAEEAPELAEEDSVEESEEALTVAPVEELPPEKISREESSDEEILDDDFIKRLKREAKKVNWKKVINWTCAGLLAILIAVPVLILAYIIITFFG